MMNITKLIVFFLFLLAICPFELFAFKEVTVHTEHKHGRWGHDTPSISSLLEYLQKSKTGKMLVALAKQKASENSLSLEEVIKSGPGSLTDTTLIRKFSPTNPTNVNIEIKSKVYINKNLKIVDAVLDLAHELTHYIYRKPFNPYSENFDLEGFVRTTVEGRGGEVDAYLMECKVNSELFGEKYQYSSRCKNVMDPETGRLSKTLGIKEFYKVGEHFDSLKKLALAYGVNIQSFPFLSEDQSKFISSAYGVPYPLAAIKEFVSVMKSACKNDEKRIVLISRKPASVSPKQYRRLENNFKHRCSAYL